MKNFYHLVVLTICSLFIISCSGNESKESAKQSEDAEIIKEEQPKQMVAAVCIWDGTSVRETPSSKGDWVSSVTLGEKVMLTGETAVDSSANNRNYVEIKLGDDKKGWVVADFVQEGTAVAVIDETPIFKRPDLLTKSDNSFESMDVLALMDSKDDWVEVIGKKQGEKWFWSGWVQRSKLTDDQVDIAVAVYGQKAIAKETEAEKVEAIQEILDIEAFTSSQFRAGLQIELNELQMEEEDLMEEADTTSLENADESATVTEQSIEE